MPIRCSTRCFEITKLKSNSGKLHSQHLKLKTRRQSALTHATSLFFSRHYFGIHLVVDRATEPERRKTILMTDAHIAVTFGYSLCEKERLVG